MSRPPAPVFPCVTCPVEARDQRLLGLYGQREPDVLMQRLKIPGGALDPNQLRAVAELSSRYAPGLPLHLTTRQDIEFHGIRSQDVPALQKELASKGLTTVGACGDTLRNITVDPGSGLEPGTADLRGLAGLVRAHLERQPCIYDLPRKFKISFSCSEARRAKPFISDLGFVARGGGWLDVVGAGSLGAAPGLAVPLYEGLSPAQVLPLVTAAIRLFDAEGNRKVRTKARLRHVRERMGDGPFRQRLDALFREELARPGWPEPVPEMVAERPLSRLRLGFPLGDMAPETAFELADAAERAGAAIRLGLEHDVFLYCERPIALGGGLARLGDAPRIVACPGNVWCARGIADTRGTALGIAARLSIPANLMICLSGCPNGCAHSAVADIGLSGRVKSGPAGRTECFRLLAGGGRGETARLGRELHPAVPAAMVPEVVERIVALWRESAATGPQDFGSFVDRQERTLEAEVARIAPPAAETD